jgi:hypothetical protein
MALTTLITDEIKYRSWHPCCEFQRLVVVILMYCLYDETTFQTSQHLIMVWQTESNVYQITEYSSYTTYCYRNVQSIKSVWSASERNGIFGSYPQGIIAPGCMFGEYINTLHIIIHKSYNKLWCYNNDVPKLCECLQNSIFNWRYLPHIPVVQVYI